MTCKTSKRINFSKFYERRAARETVNPFDTERSAAGFYNIIL
jgi:hypothetical protein